MSTMTSKTTGVSIVYLTVCSGVDQKNAKSSITGLCEGIRLWQANSQHKGPVMLTFDYIIMIYMLLFFLLSFAFEKWTTVYRYTLKDTNYKTPSSGF